MGDAGEVVLQFRIDEGGTISVLTGVQRELGQLQQTADKTGTTHQEMGNKVTGAHTQISNSVKQLHQDVTGAFSSMAEFIGKFQTAFLAVGGILAGGALFKGAVDKFVEMNSEAKKLSTTMNTSVQDASIFAGSFDRVGISGEALNSMMGRMTRQLKTNEQGFVDNQVATRDTTGAMLPLDQIAMNVIERMKDLKGGFDQGALAQLAFGRGQSDVNALLKITPELIEHTREKYASLGLTFDDLSAAKARQFKESMHDVHLVFTALEYQIGSALIPELLKLGSWFLQEGPDMIQGTVEAIKQATAVCLGLSAGWQELKILSVAAWTGISEIITGAILRIKYHMMGEMDLAEASWSLALNRAFIAAKEAANKIKALEFSTAWRIELLFIPSGQPGPAGEGEPVPGTGGDKKDGKKAPFVNKDKGGGGGGDDGAKQMESLLERLKMEFSKLSEGSLAGIDAWYDKTMKDISDLVEKGANGADAEVLAWQVGEQKKTKVVNDFWLMVAKESGDAYALIDEEYRKDLQKYQGYTGAKEQLDWIKENRRYEAYQKGQKEIEDIQKTSLQALAQASPFLSDQLAIEGRLLEVEIQRGKADQELHLQKLLNAHKISAAQADEFRGLQALADQERRMAQERKSWETQGLSGALKMYGQDRAKESDTYAKDLLTGMNSMRTSFGDFLGQGLVDAFHRKAMDIKKVGMDIADWALKGIGNLAGKHLFDSAIGGLSKMMPDLMGGAAKESPQLVATGLNTAALEANTLAMGGLTAATTVEAVATEGETFAEIAGTVAEETGTIATEGLTAIEEVVAFSSMLPFHGGGVVAHKGMVLSAHSGLASDEVMVKALRKEWILNPDATDSLAALGGPDTFNQLNSGRLPVLPVPMGGRGGSGGGDSSGGSEVNFHYNPVIHIAPGSDPVAFREAIKNHSSEVHAAVKAAIRDGAGSL